MKNFEPIILGNDIPFENHCDTENNSFNFSRTNVWDNTFSSPEISCDFALLHNDLQQIKQLICDIRDCLRNFFESEEKNSYR